MNPIVCVTEFTTLTREALRTANLLASRTSESVLLVHSVDEREQFPFTLRTRLFESDERRLAAEAQDLRQRGFVFDEVALRGMPEDGVAAFAWRARARWIVTGCIPMAALDHWALGCIAEEIAETSLVPVLAVRSATPFERWLAGGTSLNVFVGFDPIARPDALLNRVDELHQLAPCTITAAIVTYPESKMSPSSAHPTGHIHTTHADHAGYMASELRRRNITPVDLHARHDVAGDLIRHAQAAKADLLIVATHPHDDLTLLPHPALAPRVLRRAPMNVLCVPESDIEPPHTVTHAQDETPERLIATHAADAAYSVRRHGGEG